MGYTKRTTRSTGKGSRTTSTKTITNKGNTSYTASRSSGTKGGSRLTSSTKINSGERTKQYVTRNVAGYRKTTLLNPVGKTKKSNKSKSYKIKKSKPLGVIGWSVIIIIFVLLIFSN